jgi:LysR family glycine cleavage system transcriptional activator
MDVGIRYGDGRWPDLKSTFLLRDAFFPVCSPALLEGMHPLRGPEDLKHRTLIHDRAMASESAFPTAHVAASSKLSGDLTVSVGCKSTTQ